MKLELGPGCPKRLCQVDGEVTMRVEAKHVESELLVVTRYRSSELLHLAIILPI